MSKFQSKIPSADWDRALEGGLQMSRPNLLDNWYFADPVNQRGQTIYSGAWIYALDRWKLTGQSGSSLLVRSDGIFVTQDMMQKHASFECFHGSTLTLSALLRDGTLLSASGNAPTATPDEWMRLISRYIGDYGIALDLASDGSFEVILAGGGSGHEFIAAKLELGDTQTLARQDGSGGWVLNDPAPNKALELMKCQRYFQRFRTESLRPTYAEDCRPEMRAEPTKGTIAADGVTYYTLSADL